MHKNNNHYIFLQRTKKEIYKLYSIKLEQFQLKLFLYVCKHSKRSISALPKEHLINTLAYSLSTPPHSAGEKPTSTSNNRPSTEIYGNRRLEPVSSRKNLWKQPRFAVARKNLLKARILRLLGLQWAILSSSSSSCALSNSGEVRFSKGEIHTRNERSRK